VFNIGPTELGIVLVIALIVIGLAFAGLKLLAGPSRPVTPSADARAVLADRLARGEITRDEFDTAMRALGYPAPG
jgi:uncharacterized membrane protein